MIAPQLSPEQTAVAQQQTSKQKCVERPRRRSMLCVARPLASTGYAVDRYTKFWHFLAEAREAANVGDWTRASSAAKKAEVLSQELAGSL